MGTSLFNLLLSQFPTLITLGLNLLKFAVLCLLGLCLCSLPLISLNSLVLLVDLKAFQVLVYLLYFEVEIDTDLLELFSFES